MSRHGHGSLRPALERDGSDDHLVVDGSQRSADEGADPEDPLPRHKSVRGSAIACEGDVIDCRSLSWKVAGGCHYNTTIKQHHPFG